MNTLLKELINPNTALLTNTQKAVLLLINTSTSGKMAFDSTTASENLTTATSILNKLGMVTLSNNDIQITDRGSSMLQYHNLIDIAGELTDNGKAILDASKKISKSYNAQLTNETFKFLLTLS